MPAGLEDVLAILEQALSGLNITYVVGGSIASSIYGIPRSTNDVDILAKLEPHHASAIVSLLVDDFYIDQDRVTEAILQKESFSMIHLKTMYKIDVFVKKDSSWSDAEMDRKKLQAAGSKPDSILIPVSSAEDNILHKLDWYRKGGNVSERQWSDVIGIIQVQNQSLDYNYLRKWADFLGLREPLEKAISEAQS